MRIVVSLVVLRAEAGVMLASARGNAYWNEADAASITVAFLTAGRGLRKAVEAAKN